MIRQIDMPISDPKNPPFIVACAHYVESGNFCTRALWYNPARAISPYVLLDTIMDPSTGNRLFYILATGCPKLGESGIYWYRLPDKHEYPTDYSKFLPAMRFMSFTTLSEFNKHCKLYWYGHDIS